jgi:hypothetical protein
MCSNVSYNDFDHFKTHIYAQSLENNFSFSLERGFLTEPEGEEQVSLVNNCVMAPNQ